MRVLLFFLFINSYLFAQDFGDGSDGNCVFSGLQSKSTWNCVDLTVTGNTTFPGTSAIVIKVLGDVTVNNAITLSVAGSILTPGPGGSDGGDCNAGAPATCNNVSGSGSGAGGGGGVAADNNEFIGAGGGGGAGGTYNDSFAGSSGSVGSNGGATTVGGTAGSANTSGYGNEINLDTSLLGGSGGGAGGSGEDSSGGGTYNAGGDGGGGGGAIAIIAQGEITIEGSISANGGAGGNGADNTFDGTGGGGGGGSGGGIYIYSASTITVNGSISATGGAAGLKGNAVSTILGGDGGSGGKGRIRLDSQSGAFSGSGTVDPTPYQVATGSSSSGNVFDSDITYGCIVSKTNFQDFFVTILLGFLITLGLKQSWHLVTRYHQ